MRKIVVTLVLSAVVTAVGFAPASPALAGAPRLALPAPTGPRAIGTVSMRLVDRSRSDPWVPAQPYRELMVSVWYPARGTKGYPLAPYTRRGAANYLADTVASWRSWLLPAGSVDFGTVRSHGHEGAPADLRGGPHPVVLFSPGHGGPRALNTTLVEDLASHGYVVVTMDHTYETDVDFPREVKKARSEAKFPSDPAKFAEFTRRTITARVADTRTVLDRLHILATGNNPDADARPVPPGLAEALDLSRVGMFGHSDGGFTTAQAMYDDARIKAGVVVDNYLSYDPPTPDGGGGKELSPVAASGLDRPVLLFGSEQANLVHTRDPSIRSFWAHQRGWKRDLQLRGAYHISFSDLEPLLPRILAAGAVKLPPGQTPEHYLKANLGALAPDEAVTTTRAYLRAFLNLHLRQRPTCLFDGPSARYPHATLIP